MVVDIVEYISEINSTNVISTDIIDNISLVNFNNVFISILSLNIRSIKKNIDDFLVLISSIENCFDVIVLSET
jgi:hypothetical protein